MKYYEDPNFPAAFRKIAIAFILRDPHNPFDSREKAAAEVDAIIGRIGIDKLVKSHGSAYLRMSRIGLRVAINRHIRRAMISLLDNAMNHASVEIGYY